MSARFCHLPVAAWQLIGLGLCGCATVLGIDHDYGDLPDSSLGGADGAAGASSAQAGTNPAGGSPQNGKGGTSGSGGSSAGSSLGGNGGSLASPSGGAPDVAAGGSDLTNVGGDGTLGGGAGASSGSGTVVLESIQSGVTTIASGSGQQSVTINKIDPAHAFLVFGAAFDSTSSSKSELSGQITATNQVTFRRYASTGAPAIPIRYYVAHFSSGVEVQRGSHVLTDVTEKVALSGDVDLARTIPLVSYRNTGSFYGLDDFVRAELTGTSELSLSMAQASGSSTVEWQVVSFANARVQSGNVELSATDTSVELTPARPLPLDASFLLTSYQVATAPNGAADAMIQGSLTSANRIAFQRSASGTAAKLTYYAVTFEDGSRVQSGTASISKATASINLTAALDPAKSIAFSGGVYQRSGSTSYASSSNPGYATFNLDLSGGTALGVTRGPSNADAQLSWYAIAFP